MPEMPSVASSFLWGESAGFWFQTSVFILSAVIAVWTLTKNERQARRRATIDLVLHEMRDDVFRGYREKFAVMRDSGENFTLLASKKFNEMEDDEKGKREAIIALLSHYEFIATGVFEGALDENIYKRMKCSLIVKDWETLKVYVTALRASESRPKLFVELEALAYKWGKKSFWQKLKE